MVGRGIQRGGDRVAGGDGGLQDRAVGETGRLAEQHGAGWLCGRWCHMVYNRVYLGDDVIDLVMRT